MAEVVGYPAKVAVSTDGGSTYNDVGEVRNAKLDTSLSKADCTTNEDAGGAVKKTVKIEYTLSFECNYDVSDTHQQSIRSGQDNLTALYWRYRPEGDVSTKESYVCIGVPQCNVDTPTEDVAKMAVEIECEAKPTRGTVP